MNWYHPNDVSNDLDQHVDNSSLYLSKYASITGGEDRNNDEVRNRTLKRLVKLPVNRELSRAFAEMRRQNEPVGSATIVAPLGGRLIVNHSGGVLENACLALDRNTGEPYVPGSSIKGVARAAAREMDASEEETTVVFGFEAESCEHLKRKEWKASAGCVAFLPAYPEGKAELELDILTCHHMDYYGGKQSVAYDNENPTPQTFPVVKAGTSFRFVIAPVNSGRTAALIAALGLPPDFSPVAQARTWLTMGLMELGIGGKTSAGYGWFDYDQIQDQQRLESESADRKKKIKQEDETRAESERINSLSPFERAKEQISQLQDGEPFIAVAKTIEDKDVDYQRAFIQCLSARKDTWKRYRKNKPELAEKLRSIANSIGEHL